MMTDDGGRDWGYRDKPRTPRIVSQDEARNNSSLEASEGA